MTFQQQQQQQQQQQHQVQGLGPQQLHQQQQLQLTGQYLGAPLDSITLGQLRSAVNAPQKPKQTYYDYHYDDEDTLFEEINEFYAFVEADQLAENLRVWTSGPFKGEWTKAPLQQRRAFIVTLLEDLEHRDSLTRYNAARRLLYLLQGAFAESMSPEDQMHWIIENAKLVRNAQGVTLIVDALKLLSVKHDQLATISDADLARINTSPLMRQSWIDEVQAEIAICLNILYPIVAFRADDDFAEELMSMDPPLPIYLLSLLSGLSIRNRSVKSYPAKKLLLVTWKVLLACLGGMTEQTRAKALARELAGLPPLTETSASLKANPIDLQTFREETCVKYPTFLPPPLVVTASTTEATTATNAYGTDRASGISNDSGGGSGLTNLGGAAGSGADGTTSAAAVGTTDPTSNASGSGLRSIDEPPQPPSSLGRRGVATTNNNRGSLGLPTAKLAQALSPLPIRHHYVHPDANTNGNGANGAGGAGSGDDPTGTNAVLNAPAFGSGFVNPPMASTPAPSPPPSPKPKKQQYQTDQTKPFVFPFSSMAYVSSRLVPFAIDEADQLYARHMHVSLALFQTWRTREDFILDESGLEQMPGDQEVDLWMKRWSVVRVRKQQGTSGSGSVSLGRRGTTGSSTGQAGVNTRSGITTTTTTTDNKNEEGEAGEKVVMDGGAEGEDGEEEDEEEEMITWPDSKILEETLERADKEVKRLDAEIAREKDDGASTAKKAERKRAKERREDLMRLQRVETIYAACLPFMSNVVVVLLKFLIAINNISSAQANPNQGSVMFPSQPIEAPPPVVRHSLEELDALRHREIMIKGLSALLLLLLKWFKRSHIMKHYHLAFTLLSGSMHVQILRLLTYTDVAAYVITKNEAPERTFFRYCYERFSRNALETRADEFPLFAPRQGPRLTTMPHGIKADEEVEMITEFSWRNFFAIINVLKLMHKITKGNPSRITNLVHHKTSAILKRMMRISHPILQLQILKLIKGQVPYSGRKWKQLNMKLITAIYLNCRPELRDEWLATLEIEESKDSPSSMETFLRRLVAFYDYKRYGYIPPKVSSEQHQRSASLSMADPAMSPEIQMANPLASPAASDVFPPLRSQAADPSVFMPYPSEDLAFEEEYEEYLFDLQAASVPPDMVTTDNAPSWTGLSGDQPIGDGISDSESAVSIDDVPEDITGPDGNTVLPPDTEVGKNNWEHMSPKTLSALPKSPAKSPAGSGRRSSSGTGLRPVIPFDLDDPDAGSAVDDEEAPEMGPMPIERSTPFAVEDGGKGVDEVEYLYGE